MRELHTDSNGRVTSREVHEPWWSEGALALMILVLVAAGYGLFIYALHLIKPFWIG